ncbi:MAG: alpha/beta fold hydrolase, partial [Candidatus Saccharibacteria bacterium]|nr:alpha/beta fold hydrolase [Pseudorhodobacter sp.]
MPVEVILPKVDMDMTHGTLATWHVAEGDLVQKGAPLFDIETDKAAMEVEAPETGILRRVAAQPGDKVAVGTTIAWLYAEGEAVAAVVAQAAPTTATALDPGQQPTEVILPKVDMDMTHGTLSVWHVAEGEMVQQGAALFDNETDKAAMEVEAPATGRLQHITAKPGDKIPVGTVVGWIYPDSMAVDQHPVAAKLGPVSQAVPVAAPQVQAAAPVETPVTTARRATPAARKAARDHGVILAEVTGTGPLGRVQRGDVTELLSQASTPMTAAIAAGWTREPGPLNVSRRKGQGTPVVLLHGFTADSLSWAPLEKAMGPTRPLIRIDLPGHGKSPKRQIRSFQELSRMMVEAFDDATRDVEGVHIIGHSLGAALALSLADTRARRVGSLTLIGPAGLGPEIDAAALNGIVRASRVE